MPVPFSSEDLGRIFEVRSLTRGRSLVLIGAVEVKLDGETIIGTVEDKGVRRTARVTPAAMGRRVVFENRCTCRLVNCPHLAATAFLALDRFPALRRAEQATFLERMSEAPAPEKQRLLVNLEPGMPPDSCFVSFSLVGERTARVEPTNPARVLREGTASEAALALAHLLGGGEAARLLQPLLGRAQGLGAGAGGVEHEGALGLGAAVHGHAPGSRTVGRGQASSSSSVGGS